MFRKKAQRMFWTAALLDLLAVFAACTVCFMLFNFTWLHQFLKTNKSLTYRIIRAYDLVPVTMLFLPRLKKSTYDGEIDNLLSLQGLTLAEYVDKYHLDKSYVKVKKSKLVIRRSKQGALLDFMEEHMPPKLMRNLHK